MTAPQLPAPATSPAAAKAASDALSGAIDALLTVIDEETALLRTGRVHEAMALQPHKSDLSRSYAAAIAQIKASRPYMATATPALLTALHGHHDTFRARLQINLTVLATAHAVTEGIVRGVNAEVQRRNAPQTYNAYGQRAGINPRTATPIALSRSL